MEYLFLLGRILLGGYFIMSGYNHFKNLNSMAGYAQSKNVPLAKIAVFLTGSMIFLGGLGVLLGVYVQLSLSLLAIFLLGVTPKMHRYWRVEDAMMRMGERINFYKNLGLLGAILMLFSVPLPWLWSLF